jgi:hypothetical protein
MKTSHQQRLVLVWLLLSALLSAFLLVASQSKIESAVREQIRRHLLLTLDESNFGNTQNKVNDKAALQGIGKQINAAMQNLVRNHWYSARKSCDVRLQTLDGVTIDGTPVRRHFTFTLPRNQIEREVVVGLSCSPNWVIFVGAAGVLGLLFLVINVLLPPPVTKIQRQWIDYLLARGYGEAEAVAIIRRYNTTRIDMSPAQLQCLEQLHNTELRNIAQALEVVTDERVAALGEDEIDWFLLGLSRDPGNLAGALTLARAEDSVVIDLNEMSLSIRGLNVPMSGTPLFYYAWYAMQRLQGEGWITNPASNRPDRLVARELINLMSRFDGHARAINDLEQSGLKARTLDQNRSKIKDDIGATLGESLAKAYLFEARKHPDGIQMSYRLSVDAARIQLVG